MDKEDENWEDRKKNETKDMKKRNEQCVEQNIGAQTYAADWPYPLHMFWNKLALLSFVVALLATPLVLGLSLFRHGGHNLTPSSSDCVSSASMAAMHQLGAVAQLQAVRNMSQLLQVGQLRAG